MAGLLDAIFPSSDGGGLLDFLKRNAMNQAMPSGPQSDTAQYGAAPQMPQQGLIPQAPVPQNPPPVIRANLPPMAAPQAPMAAPQAAPSAGPLPFPNAGAPGPAGGFLGNLARAISNIPRGGADDPAVVAQRQQAQTMRANYQALVDKGVTPNIAFAAVQPGNTEMLKSVWDRANGQNQFSRSTDKDGNIFSHNNFNGQDTLLHAGKDDKFIAVKTGADAMGRESYELLNQSTGEHMPLKPAGGGEDVGSGLPGDITKTGDDYINSLPKQYQGIVRGFVEGTAKMPVITTKNQQAMQNYFDMAKQADDSFDSANYPARVAGMKSFKAGQDATTVRSANQVLGHISDLADKADALHNGSYPALNHLKNSFDSAVGSGAANNWVIQAHAVADELSGFMKGAGHNSDSEIRAWNDSLTPNMSPEQQRGAIQTLMGIYQHALQALEDKRTNAIGPQAAAKMGPLLTPAGQAAAAKIQRWANPGQAAPVAPAAPAAPKLGVGESATINGVTIKKTSEANQ